jgi:hypothetical protein
MKALSAIAVAALILIAVVVSLEMSGGALQDTSGVVESVTVMPGAAPGVADRYATVLLSNGKRVNARIAANENLVTGQTAYVRVSHAPSGEWTFEASGEKEPIK